MATSEMNNAALAAATTKEGSIMSANVNVEGTHPLAVFALVAGVGICGYIAVKLVNKYTREKKVEITEK